MNILTMDTATQEGCAALLQGDRCLAQRRLPASPGQAVTLPVSVAELLAQVGWSWSALQLVVVTLGPGSFTGVRIALGFAKGIALAHGVPVVGVPTLEALAAGSGQQVAEGGWLLALMDARRGELFASLHRCQGGRVVPCRVAHCLPPEELAGVFAAETAGEKVIVTGGVPPSIIPGWPENWQMAVDQQVGINSLVLAGIGQRIYLEQGGASPLLEPLYVRPSEAEAKKGVLP